ncbi:MAG: hypothetical protein JNM90_05645 [Burkholderiales bacterium]|nr:hypothetical protein [Burkholderiales bacterium]
MQPDPVLARGLASRYGKADREIRKLIRSMAEVRAAAGKKTLFGGSREEAAVKAFLEQLFETCGALVDTRVLNEASTKAQSLSALNSVLGSYRLAYPGETEAFRAWDDFFRYQVTVEPHKPWLKSTA